MLKLSLIATGLSFPSIAIANGLKHSTDKESFILMTLLALFSMTVFTQIGFYLRHVLRQSENK